MVDTPRNHNFPSFLLPIVALIWHTLSCSGHDSALSVSLPDVVTHACCGYISLPIYHV